MNRLLTRLGVPLVLVIMVSLTAPPVYAQGSTTSTITGRVVDSSGGVLPGASITAKHLATHVTSNSVTNSEGAFTIASLAPGT
jgi:hypothetical protein